MLVHIHIACNIICKKQKGTQKMTLKRLEDFCKGTAESEFGAGIIDKIFVNTGILNDIIDMLPGSPKILVGHKGTGKSIIFRQLNSYLTHINIPALYLTPSEIVHKEPPSETPAVLQAFYYEALVFAVASKLGESFKSYSRKMDQARSHRGRGRDECISNVKQ